MDQYCHSGSVELTLHKVSTREFSAISGFIPHENPTLTTPRVVIADKIYCLDEQGRVVKEKLLSRRQNAFFSNHSEYIGLTSYEIDQETGESVLTGKFSMLDANANILWEKEIPHVRNIPSPDGQTAVLIPSIHIDNYFFSKQWRELGNPGNSSTISFQVFP